MFSWLRKWLQKGLTENRIRGDTGEHAAADFFIDRLGYKLVIRNWKHRKDEIDLVCKDGDVFVFIEVKTRSAGALVSGYYAIDERKRKALRRVIHAYLSQLDYKPLTIRFDVAEVALSEHLPPQVIHFENVPLFPKGYHALRG
ncbi:MAG TPA: YraN family protein [Opitutaceae bacterium]|nr:YraN family protein [Opitutaceae bacterium]